MLAIGSLQLDFPVVQAALSGYSDLPMRRVARLHGAGFTFNEVVLDKLLIAPGRKRRPIIRVADDDHPVGGQLMGAQPDSLAQAADALVQAGYDCVDLNFACPVRKVLGRCRGGFLLSRPPAALEIVKAVHQAVGGRRPVMVKMRRGPDASPESERNFYAILDGAFAVGVDAVTVHPRTVQQRYAGRSDWSFLAAVKKHVGGRVVLGSGDLFCAADGLRMLEQTGVDGVAIARGGIGNPWIFADCRALLAGEPLPPPPAVAEQGRTIARHFHWLIEAYGEKKAGPIMRKFGIRYSRLHPRAPRVRDAFIKVGDLADLHAVLHEWYDPHKDWPPAHRPTDLNDLIAAGAEE